MTEFEQFWSVYPRRVAKLDAQRAFVKARKVASLDVILAGVERYIADKPAYADWCHPATWLNRGRWMDEPDRRTVSDRRAEPRGADRRSEPTWAPWTCPHEPSCTHRWRCHQRTQLEAHRVS